MTIVASGEISLGGNATVTRSVACELGRSGTGAICMDESAVRTLAGQTTAASAICMNDFYSKSDAVPTAFGQFVKGGYYAGVAFNNCCAYYLFIAPNASGCACCQWKTTATLTNNCSNSSCNYDNGYWNTFTYLNNAVHPAGNWTATRTIGGFTDWYLPSRNELHTIYRCAFGLPAGEGFASTTSYFTSSESDSNVNNAFIKQMNSTFPAYSSNKSSSLNIRAVRRTAFTPAAPSSFGQPIYGGFYMGTISSPANYYLIVAPNALGCACCLYNTNNSLDNLCSNATCNTTNGYWNTYTYLNNTNYPAGNWAATRNMNGFTDWYLPSRAELRQLYDFKGSLPTGEGFAVGSYLSSTEVSDFTSCAVGMTNGTCGGVAKTTNCRLRVVRRVPF